MIRALLIAALLVAGVAPAWAQSDSRWIALFKSSGRAGQGSDASDGNTAKAYISETNHIVTVMLDRMAIPYKVILLPDSAGGWARQIGDTRDTDEADSTHFRKNGCMGWIFVMDEFSTSDGTVEIARFFTDAEGNRGAQRGSPIDGRWGIPGLVLTTDARNVSGLSIFNGAQSRTQKSGTARTRQGFVNGDSISMVTVFSTHVSPAELADVTQIIRADSLTEPTVALGGSMIAWLYKSSTLYYNISSACYENPAPIMLGMADLIGRAGYVPRRKLNLHIDLDHPFPDATVQTAPSESLFAYMDAMPWRYGGAYEAHASEVTGGSNPDNPTLKTMWSSRSRLFPGDPHSHQYMNFYPNSTTWNMSTFADSATKRARWNDLVRSIKDTLQVTVARGYDKTATFPDNNVNFPDLYIMASGGYRDIRSKPIGAASGIDSTGVPASVSLRRWQQVPGPRRTRSGAFHYGLPYMYIEPKTNLPLWVHDSVEHPSFGDSLYVNGTDFGTDMEGYAARSLSGHVRMAIFDGGQYWHPDVNVTGGNTVATADKGRFMADFYRRLTYFYGRTKNILTIDLPYRPKTPRRGGTSRTTYSDNR